MSNPTRAFAPREDLAAAYLEFDPASDGMIGDIVLPMMPVNKRRGQYGVVPREAFLSAPNTKRTPKAATATSEWDPENASFQLVEYAHKGFVDRVLEEDFDTYMNLQEIETQRNARIIATDAERDAANLIFNTTSFPTTGGSAKGAQVSNAWNTANGTPLEDIEAGLTFIEENFGVEANALIINRQIHRTLSLNEQVRDAILQVFGVVKPGLIPAEQLGTILNVPRLIVAGGSVVYNSAKPGQPAAISRIWSSNFALLTRIDEGRDIQRPQLGRTFTLADKSEGIMIDSKEEWDPDGTWIRARRHMQRKLSPDPVGYLMENIFSS